MSYDLKKRKKLRLLSPFPIFPTIARQRQPCYKVHEEHPNQSASQMSHMVDPPHPRQLAPHAGRSLGFRYHLPQMQRPSASQREKVF